MFLPLNIKYGGDSVDIYEENTPKRMKGFFVSF